MQSGLVRWETLLLSLERDHEERLSPKIRRALLLNILPATLQSRLLEHLDRRVDYAQVREKVVSLVQSQKNPDAIEFEASLMAAISPYTMKRQLQKQKGTRRRKKRWTLQHWQT